MTSTAVRVALRVRPLTQKEQFSNCTECISFIPNQPQILIGKDHSFTYDYVFDTHSSQQPIYDTSVVPLVEKFVDGFNATILAYGQTGSGKTYSMGTALDENTNSEHQGIVPRFIHDLFKRLASKKESGGALGYQVFVSFLELYNEDLVDLLNHQKKKAQQVEVQIREDVHGQIYWSGVREEPCQTPDDLLRYLSKGSLCRTTGSTDMNSVSSRSHAIFSVIIKQQVPEENGENATTADSRTIISKFHFVDLAGSERLKRTNAQGDRAREGISINSGLLALGNVISALGDDSRKSVHVPYRDSKLTRLLQDSLGGNSQTLMMACVSPSDSNFLETLSTLKYANRARNIKNKVTINQEFAGSSVEVNQLRSQVARLKLELNALRASSSVAGNGKTPSDIMLQNMVGGHNTNAAKALKEEIDRLKERVRSMSDDICRITTERDSLLMERELAQHMGSSEDWSERRPSFYESNNNAINTLPIVAQYQKTIQDLKNELMDVQERLAFSESIRAPLMHAAMAGVSTPHTSKTTANALQQQHSSTTNGKRRLGNKKRRNGSTTTTSRNVTFRSTKRSKVPHVTKKPVAVAASTTDEDDSDIESWLKETMGNIQTSESSGLRVDAKHSISNARSQIDKALKVLDECKAKEVDEVEYDCDILADDELFVQLQSEDNASLFGDIESEFANDSSKSEGADAQVPQQRAPRSRMVSAEMDDTELADFYENNPQYFRMVNQIQSDIQVNEDLVLQLEKTEVEYGQMRKKFEQKIYALRDEILTLRREQQQQQQQQQQPVVNPLAKRRDSAASLNNMNTIRQAYEMKMKALMGQLSDLRRKYTQTSSTIQSSRNQNESMLRALRVNVESLKVEKRRMIKRMKDEAERVKEKLHSHEREIQNLRRKQTKDNEHKRRLERELKQMELTLQKKTDESVITAQKLKSLVKILKKAVREGGVLDEKLLASCGSLLDMGSALVQSSHRNMARRKRVSKKQQQPRIPAEARAAKKKVLLDNALYQFIQGKQAVEEMKQLLAKRNDLSQRKIEYMSERELLLLDEDSKDLSTIDHAFRQVIDENIETVEAEISYLNARIHAIHNDAAAEIMQDEEDGNDEVVLLDNRATAPEKRVTFADPSKAREEEEEVEDEWLDMDALEERYSLPASAGPDQALETISRLIKSMANDEASLIMESAIDDIVLLRMEEHNNKMTIQQLEKSSQDLRRTLIVMKKAAIETTIENERKLKRLQLQQQQQQQQQSMGPSRRTSMSRDRSCSKLSNHSSPTMEDSSDADSAIDLYSEEQYQHVESLFDKIYNDGINGKIEDYSIIESPLTIVAENELNPYLRPHPTSVSSNRLNAVSAPMKPSTSPLANRRDSMSSPEQFLMQMMQTPKDVRPPPSPLMKPAEFARYQHDRESSTSSIRSVMRRRSSVQSVESLGSSTWSGQQMTRASSGSKLPPAAVPTATTTTANNNNNNGGSELPPVLNRRRAFSFQQPPSTQPPPSMPSTLRRRSLLREIVPPPPQPVSDMGMKSPQHYFDNREYSTHGTTFIPGLQKQRSYSVLAMHAPQHNGNNVPRPSTAAMRRVDSSPNNSYELRRSAAANNVFDRLSSGHTQASQAKKRPGNYRYSSSSIDDLRTQWANELSSSSQKNNHHDDNNNI